MSCVKPTKNHDPVDIQLHDSKKNLQVTNVKNNPEFFGIITFGPKEICRQFLIHCGLLARIEGKQKTSLGFYNIKLLS